MTILEDKIVKAATAYYTTGDVIMSDDQFDKLVAKLKKTEPESKILTSVGWGAKFIKAKKRHPVFIDSLNKYKYPATIDYFDSSETVVIAPKLDGLSAVLYFSSQGPFIALTRGGGTLGVVITDKLEKILDKKIFENIKELKSTCKFIGIRGELVILNKHKEHLEERGIYNLRNHCSGIIGRNPTNEDVELIDIRAYDEEDIKLVDFIPYSIVVTHARFQVTKKQTFELFNKIGFTPIPYYTVDAHVSPKNMLKRYTQFKKDYPIDGIVLSSNKVINNEIGKNEYELVENSMAYKFPSETKDVKVIKVEWEAGASGRITPVVHFKPTFLSGATLSKATGFNYEFIIDSKIGEGAIITITRANEVIPYIIKVVKPSISVLYPRNCSCGTELSVKGVNLFCSNILCSAKIFESIYRLMTIARIPNGIGKTVIHKWIELCNIKKLEDTIKQVTNNDTDRKNFLMKNLGNHYGALIFTLEGNIKSKLEEGIYPHEFWYIVNLEGVGHRMSERIPHPYEVADGTIEDLPINVIKSLNTHFRYWRNLAYKFKMKVNKNAPIETKMQVAITGTLSSKRAVIQRTLIKNGVKVGNVSSKTSYLICNKADSSTKYKAAQKLNIKIVTEKEFTELTNIKL